MLRVGHYLFKRAETAAELEQVHRLNHRTFVEEIPQHPASDNGLLIDKFHDKNVYFIGVRAGRVVGMVSAHDRPPFSITDRLPDRSILDRPGSRPLEVRLLAIEPDERHGTVFAGLVWTLYQYACAQGFTELYISGVADRIPLYRHLGFVPLGPAVRCGRAEFVPMRVGLAELAERMRRPIELWKNRLERVAGDREPVCLLPGPVTVPAAVREAFGRPPIYHRGAEFAALFQKVRRELADLANARDAALFNGSGTLANEVVAATLRALDGDPHRGVILVNGEFGERLVRQAGRFGLWPRVLRWPWGRPWNLDEVESALDAEPAGSWVWGVHLESSTGVLNDLPGLVRRARQRGLRVCADCISSLGAVPLDLSEVFLASGASGKSLGSYAGVAVVFSDAAKLAGLKTESLPSYLDLPASLASSGPRFTFPSPLLAALDAALGRYADGQAARRYADYAALGRWVRERLRELGLAPCADEAHASPVITTFAPPAGQSAEQFVDICRGWNFQVGGQSSYLADRRLVQLATMGAVTQEDCAPLFDHLADWLTRQ